jgi:beta-glucosidase
MTTLRTHRRSAILVDGGASVSVVVNVTNTGSVASKQVVGAYYSRTVSAFVRHHQRLFAFGKTPAPVAPGATATLSLAAPTSSLAYWDPASQKMVVEPGAYTVTVGPDSVTASGTATIAM